MQCLAAGSALTQGCAACRRCQVPVFAALNAARVPVLINTTFKRAVLPQKCNRAAHVLGFASRNEGPREPSQGASFSGQNEPESSGFQKLIASAAKALGLVGFITLAVLSGPTRAAHARDRCVRVPDFLCAIASHEIVFSCTKCSKGAMSHRHLTAHPQVRVLCRRTSTCD